MKNQVAFEKLGIGPFNLDRVAFSIGNIDIYWYAVLITAGMLPLSLRAVTAAASD